MKPYRCSGQHGPCGQSLWNEGHLDYLQVQNADYAIPPKSNARVPWRCDWSLYKERHLVECFFLKLQHFRHLATRYDKLASAFLAYIYLSATFILLK
jgi:hypothetical protein